MPELFHIGPQLLCWCRLVAAGVGSFEALCAGNQDAPPLVVLEQRIDVIHQRHLVFQSFGDTFKCRSHGRLTGSCQTLHDDICLFLGALVFERFFFRRHAVQSWLAGWLLAASNGGATRRLSCITGFRHPHPVADNGGQGCRPKEKDRQIDSERQRQTETNITRQRHTDRQTDRQRQMEAETNRDTQTQRDKLTHLLC